MPTPLRHQSMKRKRYLVTREREAVSHSFSNIDNRSESISENLVACTMLSRARVRGRKGCGLFGCEGCLSSRGLRSIDDPPHRPPGGPNMPKQSPSHPHLRFKGEYPLDESATVIGREGNGIQCVEMRRLRLEIPGPFRAKPTHASDGSKKELVCYDLFEAF